MPDAGVDQSDDGPAWVVSPSGLCRTVRASSRAVRDLACVGHCAHFGGARFASAPRLDTPRALGVVFTPVVGATLPLSLSLCHSLLLSPSPALPSPRSFHLTLPRAPLCALVLFLPPTRVLAVERTYTYAERSHSHAEPRARLSSSVVGLTDPLLSLPALLSLTDTPIRLQRQPSSSRRGDIREKSERENDWLLVSRIPRAAAGGGRKARFFQNATLPSRVAARERGEYDFLARFNGQTREPTVLHPVRKLERVVCRRKSVERALD